MNKQLKQLREDKGLLQREVAKLLGVKQSTISDWESGKKMPKLRNILQIANLYNISVDKLINNAHYKSNELVYLPLEYSEVIYQILNLNDKAIYSLETFLGYLTREDS